MQELAPKLEKLRLKAVAKARDYMLGRIAELKKPKTHVQVGEQQARREGGRAGCPVTTGSSASQQAAEEEEGAQVLWARPLGAGQ